MRDRARGTAVSSGVRQVAPSPPDCAQAGNQAGWRTGERRLKRRPQEAFSTAQKVNVIDREIEGRW